MLQKWKSILINWVNCYFNDSRIEQNLNLECLLNIISHLRENLNLDESKSSKLSAHSVEEFIKEKYPEFKFENGTVEANNEEQVCLAASLLLFFVCVNSKDIDIKSAMCSKLSDADQEIILKFSKSLMGCSPILCRDVHAAIADACGHDMATVASSSCVKVAETPPALRSLHSEVRRLQAALDAERFDRNYLQDELTRTNMRVEKLLKEKEEYKLDIVDLKTKISLCCGQENETSRVESHSDKSAKLAKQLQEMEERLVHTQGELDDAIYERDTYKAKVEELKQDRDKWFAVSEQETMRASQLSEELDIERQNTQSLRELVNELRQHNRLNRQDSSLLECDDPDASIQSLPHNLSVCSEVCANVVEVQLGEERAKIVVLKQQIQALQDQMNELTQKYEDNKLTLETIINEKETDIFNLKHRINEEIEGRNNLRAHFSDEMSKLNNEINELEQKLKDNNDSARSMIEQKMQDIQTLQEEKLSLLQSLSNETTKLENIIKDLKSSLDTERQSKMNMKDSYDSHIMKLNEKMLNRNNELVELQNNIFEKSEIIESLHLDLRREKEMRDELSNKYHNNMSQMNEEKNAIEHHLQKIMHENTELKTMLEEKNNLIEGLYRELDNIKLSLANCSDNCKTLEEDKAKLIHEVQNRDIKLEEIFKDIENLKNVFSEERGKLCFDLDERNAIINTLKMQLHNEIQYKIGLENDLKELQNAKGELMDKLNKASVEISELHSTLKEKDKNINDMDIIIQEELENNKKSKLTVDKLNKQMKKMSSDFKLKCNELTSLNTQIEELNKSFHNQIESKDSIIEAVKKEKKSVVMEKEALQMEVSSLKNNTIDLEKAVAEKADIILQLQMENKKLSETIEEDKKAIQIVEQKLTEQHQKYIQLENNFDTQTSKMFVKLNETEKIIKELSTNSKKSINNKEFQIQTLNMELDNIRKVLENNQAHVTVIQAEKHALKDKLDEEISYRNKIEEEYRNQCTLLEINSTKFNEEIYMKNIEISTLKTELQNALKNLEDKCAETKKLDGIISANRELIYEKSNEIKEIRSKLTDIQCLNDELEQELKKEMNSKKQTIQALQKENEQLHFTIEEDNSNHELLIREKDRIIDSLEQQLKLSTVQLEALKKDYEDMTLTCEKLKIETQEKLEAKTEKINQLTSQVKQLGHKLSAAAENNNAKNEEIEKLTNQLEASITKQKEDKIIKDNIEAEKEVISHQVATLMQANKELVNTVTSLTKELAEEKSIRSTTEEEKIAEVSKKKAIEQQLAKEILLKNKILEEKECLTQQFVEEKSAKELAEKEKENVVEEKYLMEHLLCEEKNNVIELTEEVKGLHQKLATMEDIVKIEKSAKEATETEKVKLSEEIQGLKLKLSVEEKTVTVMKQEMEDNICRLKNLEEIIERTKTELEIAHREKEHKTAEKQLLQQKLCALESKAMELEQEINNIISKYTVMEETIKTEKAQLCDDLKKVKTEKDKLLEENQCLVIDNSSLKDDISNRQVIQDTLENDKMQLITEKEILTVTVSKEKSALDELEKEKDNLKNKIDEINEQYNSELVAKAKEFESIAAEIEHLKLDYQNQLQENTRVSSNLNIGLERIIQNFRAENLSNEVLQKLLAVDTRKISVVDKCELLINVVETLYNEVKLRQNLEKALEDENTALGEMQEICKQKEMQILNLQMEVKRSEQVSNEYKLEMSKQNEVHTTAANSKSREIQMLQQENETLRNDLNDVKLQLEIKVHSLKEKLTDNEHLTDKLKRSYECQIDNLNMMITKLTAYLKDKTVELDVARKEKETLQNTIEENLKAIKALEVEVQNEKKNQEKLINDFESERLVLKNMVTVTESVMEDQKISLNNVIAEHVKAKESLQDENKILKDLLENEKDSAVIKLQDKDLAIEKALKELAESKEEKITVEETMKTQKQNMEQEITLLRNEIILQSSVLKQLQVENKEIEESLQKHKNDVVTLQDEREKLKIVNASIVTETQQKIDDLISELNNQKDVNTQLEAELKNKTKEYDDLEANVKELKGNIISLENEKHHLESTNNELKAKLDEIEAKLQTTEKREKDALETLQKENAKSVKEIEDQKIVITNLEQLIKHELEENQMLRDDNANDKLSLVNKFSLLQDWQMKAEQDIEGKQKDIAALQDEVVTLRAQIENYESALKAKDEILSELSKEKDSIISTISKELLEEKTLKEKWQKECENKIAALCDLQGIEAELRRENEELVKVIGQRETFAVQNEDKSNPRAASANRERQRHHHQVDNSSDLTQSSMESFKTITDLEKIIHDKNRTITTLQSDITYLKTLMAESETRLMDVTNDLEVSKENCQQLSNQLKKIVYQKNEEIAELKKQVNKMTVTENRATQIIKVSAKYQAIILKRIAEIKSNTVLKELTNFGNSNVSDNELRRSLNVGTITMEDLENFLETTDKHLKRCSERQIALQKERDRLSEINRINESEIINLKKFLTELSVSFQTFNSVRDLYSQKLSRVVSIQRTVRREVLSLDGHVTDACMCKLERGYAAVMQDLSECSMNLERWVERCVLRALSPEKIKQAFMGEYERTSLASTSFQNAGLEVQLEELDKSFQKLLEEVARAAKGEGAKDAQAVTVQEVRAEYEDKLNRMKAKMKQLYQEQIQVFKEKQREEVQVLEREVSKARAKLSECSAAYEQHIRALTAELWSVGEKFLVKQDEADWLRNKHRSASLMSLQHVHSSGLAPPQEDPGRPSDTQSLRSLPVNNKSHTKKDGRGLHMSDEEGEVFDNRWLKELSATPRAEGGSKRGTQGGTGGAQGGAPGLRLSELRWRNSLCPPHLKSSYPAETQFAPALHEDDIKFSGVGAAGKQQRKEVGITAYKKPGPPTPSKQAGRLSATDSELRELRAESEASRKTSTPSRLRALFRSHKHDNDSTPRSRRLSNIFKKK